MIKVNALKRRAGGSLDNKVETLYQVERTAHFKSTIERGIRRGCVHGCGTDESRRAAVIEHKLTRYDMVRWDTMAQEQKIDRSILIGERKKKMS